MPSQTTLFKDREDAGRELARKLELYPRYAHTQILALPRGGVAVAYEVARHFGFPLDVFVVRKLGLPGHEEVAMGAIAYDGTRVLNSDLLKRYPVSEEAINAVVEKEMSEVERREAYYRGSRPPPKVEGKCVILIDDGLATGNTMQAAVESLRRRHPGRLVVAVPVAPLDTCREFRRWVDDVICLATPFPFYSVGTWYEDFPQLSDDEVCGFLGGLDDRNFQYREGSRLRDAR